MKIKEIIIFVFIAFVCSAVYGEFLSQRIKKGSEIVQQVVEKREYHIQENESIEKTIDGNLKNLGSFSCAGFGAYFTGLAPVMTREGLAMAYAPDMPSACKGEIVINNEKKEVVVAQKDFSQGMIIFKINGDNFNVINLASTDELMAGKRFYTIGAGNNHEIMASEGMIAGVSEKKYLLNFYGRQPKAGWLVFDFSGNLLGFVKKQGEEFYLIGTSDLREMLSKKK